MATIFLVCAIVGGTVLVCQFLMTIAGMGGHGLDVDGAGAHDVPHDFQADVGSHDLHAAEGHAPDAGDQHHSTWLFGVITFRTLVAAATFFGIAGMAARSAELTLPNQLLIALACGVGAMYSVHWLMRAVSRLGEDHTVRITHAIGQEGTVYLPIPGDQAGAGRIHLNLQGRLMEYSAVTSAKATLMTGARVVVVAARGSSTLEVQPVPEPVSEERPA
jgi:membrane protein implicated in regulation of membrane protease activity